MPFQLWFSWIACTAAPEAALYYSMLPGPLDPFCFERKVSHLRGNVDAALTGLGKNVVI
jgi:hypothetical protein